MNIKFRDFLTIYVDLFPISPELLNREFTETEIANAFGVTLRALREHKNFSLNGLSAEIDIPNPTINRYENGINIPTITQAVKIVSFFNLPFEMFVLLGMCNIYEKMEIAKAYDKFQNDIAEAHKKAVINRAQRKK